jgi:hypothetical protein
MTTVEEPQPEGPQFVLYLENADYHDAVNRLALWVRHLLLPVYAREITSSAPWCPQWWQHPEAVAQLYGLWMAWQQLSMPAAGLTGPASWHRDFLGPAMLSLRDPSGPFAGCKPGAHRAKEVPQMDDFPG